MSISRFVFRAIAAASLLSAVASGAAQAQPLVASHELSLWWEPGNGGVPGGTLTGWTNLFETPSATWPKGASAARHLMLRDNTLMKQQAGWIEQKLAPFVKTYGMSIELDSWASTGWTCDGGHPTVLRHDVALIEEMQDAGINVDYVSLQNTVSRQMGLTDFATGNPCYPSYTLQQRVRDVVTYINGVKALLTADHRPIPKFMLTDSNLRHQQSWFGKVYGTANLYDTMTKAFNMMAAASPPVKLDALKIDVAVEGYCTSGDLAACAQLHHPTFVTVGDLAVYSDWLAKQGILPVTEIAVNHPASGADVVAKVNWMIAAIESTPGINLRDFQLCLFKPSPGPTTYLSERNAASETYLLGQISAGLAPWKP